MLLVSISSTTFASYMQGFCDADETSDMMYGDYLWPETRVGRSVTRPCNHGGLGDNPMARRFCDIEGSWNDVIFNECFTLITSQYQQFDIVS